MSIATVGGWLQAYGVSDFAGRCTFKYKDTIDFTVELSDDEGFLYLSAVLGELAESDNEALLLQLLQLNHLGIATRGTSLSVDDTGRHIILWYGRPVAGLDAELFGNLTGSFLDTAESLRQRILTDADSVSPSRFSMDAMIRV